MLRVPADPPLVLALHKEPLSWRAHVCCPAPSLAAQPTSGPRPKAGQGLGSQRGSGRPVPTAVAEAQSSPHPARQVAQHGGCFPRAAAQPGDGQRPGQPGSTCPGGRLAHGPPQPPDPPVPCALLPPKPSPGLKPGASGPLQPGRTSSRTAHPQERDPFPHRLPKGGSRPRPQQPLRHWDGTGTRWVTPGGCWLRVRGGRGEGGDTCKGPPRRETALKSPGVPRVLRHL